jgi:hypothetical protein
MVLTGNDLRTSRSALAGWPITVSPNSLPCLSRWQSSFQFFPEGGGDFIRSDLTPEELGTPMGTPLGDEPAGNRNLPAQSDPDIAKVHYLYEAKIKNNGAKTIRGIDWTFLLFDPETQTEVGRCRFTSKVNVRGGKAASLVARSRTPLTQVVQAKASSKSEKPVERVVIDRIEYDDGSVWQRPSN